MKFLWITDPWNTLDHESDTTLRLMQEAALLGHTSYWCDVHSIRLEQEKGLLDAALFDPSQAHWDMHQNAFPVDDFKSIQYRVDPPVDQAYLHPLQILEATRGGAEIVNAAPLLFSCNEKWEGLLIPGLSPPCVISSDRETLLKFAKREGKCVLKPLHTAQSKGIELIDAKHLSNAIDSLKNATSNFKLPIELQKFLPGITEGETRLWFTDGKLIGVVRKLPVRGDFKVDIDRGSLVKAHALDAREKKASVKIAAHLKKRKIRLAAVDLIEGLISDFNITSPGLIVQMEKALQKNLSQAIIRCLASKRS